MTSAARGWWPLALGCHGGLVLCLLHVGHATCIMWYLLDEAQTGLQASLRSVHGDLLRLCCKASCVCGKAVSTLQVQHWEGTDAADYITSVVDSPIAKRRKVYFGCKDTNNDPQVLCPTLMSSSQLLNPPFLQRGLFYTCTVITCFAATACMHDIPSVAFCRPSNVHAASLQGMVHEPRRYSLFHKNPWQPTFRWNLHKDTTVPKTFGIVCMCA